MQRRRAFLLIRRPRKHGYIYAALEAAVPEGRSMIWARTEPDVRRPSYAPTRDADVVCAHAVRQYRGAGAGGGDGVYTPSASPRLRIDPSRLAGLYAGGDPASDPAGNPARWRPAGGMAARGSGFAAVRGFPDAMTLAEWLARAGALAPPAAGAPPGVLTWMSVGRRRRNLGPLARSRCPAAALSHRAKPRVPSLLF